jgi:hypothetical protein
MGEDSRQDATGPLSTERVSVPQAADHLGTTVDALRKRVQRGTIPHEKDREGRVWILLDTGRPRQDTAGHRQDADQPQSDNAALISEMRGRIEDLQAQLEAERQAHSEARTLLLRALERIPPAIEPPREMRETPESAASPDLSDAPTDAPGDAQEAAQSGHSATLRPQGNEARARPWWRRVFGR